MATNTTRELYEILVTTAGSKATIDALNAATRAATESINQLKRDSALASAVVGGNLTSGFSRANGALRQTDRQMKVTSQSINNAAFQVQDFFVQIAMGTSFMRAFSQQAPQLLGAFSLGGGPFSLVLAGVATLITILPVAINYFGLFGEKTADVADLLEDAASKMNAFKTSSETALTPLTKLADEYGRFAVQIRLSSQYLSDLNFVQATAAISAAAAELTPKIDLLTAALENYLEQATYTAEQQYLVAQGFGSNEVVRQSIEIMNSYSDEVRSVGAELGLTTTQAIRLQNELADLGNASTVGDIATEADEVLRLIRQWFPSASLLTPEIANIVVEVTAIQEQAAGVADMFQDASDAATSLQVGVQGVGIAIDSASSGAQVLVNRMISAARAVGALMASVRLPANGIGRPNGTSATGDLRLQIEAEREANIEAARSAADAIIAANEAAARALEGPTGGGGVSERIAELTDAQKLLNEAIEDGRTDIQQAAIDYEALSLALEQYRSSLTPEDVAAVNEELERLARIGQEISPVFKTIEGTITSAFDGMIEGTESVADAFEDMLLKILQDVAKFLVSRQITSLMNILASSFGGFGITPVAPAPGGLSTFSVPSSTPSSYSAKATTYGSTTPGSPISGGQSLLNVNINNTVSDTTDVSVEEKTNANGIRSLEIMMTRKIKESFSNGSMDKTMASAFGVRRMPA